MASPRQVVECWVEAFNRADVEALAAMYAEDAINHQVAESPVRGRAAIRRMFADGFSAAKMVCMRENLIDSERLAVWLSPDGRVVQARIISD